MRVVAVVLAAGTSSRFGSPKLIAPLRDRAILQHVLDALAASPVDAVIVVLGRDAARIEAAVAWRAERRVVNPRPEDGLASSLGIGLAAAGEDRATDAALVVLGDQPGLRPDVVATILDAAAGTTRPIIRPRYASDPAPNPVFVRRATWAIAASLEGDRGLGSFLASHPELVAEVAVTGAIPDVDTPGDLAALTTRDA